MDEKDLKTPQSGDTCPTPDNSTQGQLPDQDDQKLIENHEKLLIENHERLLIEDKEAAAAAATVADVEPEKPVKKRWFGWWACALVAAAVIGICLYFGTKDSQIATQRIAASKAAVANANASRNGGTTLLSNGKALSSDASASLAANGKNVYAARVANGAAGHYAYATEESIEQKAKDESSVDYLYYFGNDQSEVGYNELLDEIAARAVATDADITITAYASETGSPAYNDNLCHERAENLADYLEEHGVNADNITIKSGGQTDRYGAYAYNRRADIVVDYAG